MRRAGTAQQEEAWQTIITFLGGIGCTVRGTLGQSGGAHRGAIKMQGTAGPPTRVGTLAPPPGTSGRARYQRTHLPACWPSPSRFLQLLLRSDPPPPRRFSFNKKVATKAAVLHKMGHDNNNLTIHTKSQQMRFRLDVRVLMVQITHLPKRFFACLYVFSDGRLARGISFSPPTAYQEVVPPKHGSRVTCLNCTLRTPRIGAGERRRSDRDADGSWRLQLIAVSGMRGKGKRGEKCCCCCWGASGFQTHFKCWFRQREQALDMLLFFNMWPCKKVMYPWMAAVESLIKQSINRHHTESINGRSIFW